MGTTCDNASAGAIKGNTVVMITMFASTNANCGVEQIKALLKAVVDQV
jgi:hypothetical protein